MQTKYQRSYLSALIRWRDCFLHSYRPAFPTVMDGLHHPTLSDGKAHLLSRCLCYTFEHSNKKVFTCLRTLWLPLTGEHDCFFKQTAPREEEKNDYVVKCQCPSQYQGDWQGVFVLLECLSSQGSINVSQASGARMKASQVINSIYLLSSLEAKKRASWKGDFCYWVLRRGMDKEPGDIGPGRESTCWELSHRVFRNSRTVCLKVADLFLVAHLNSDWHNTELGARRRGI